MKKVTAISKSFFSVGNGRDKFSSSVDLSMTINICSPVLGLVLNAICSKLLLGSSLYFLQGLSRAFQHSCSVCISTSQIKKNNIFIASFTEYQYVQIVSILTMFLVSPNHQILIDGIMIFNPWPSMKLVGVFRNFLYHCGDCIWYN